jgi:hypothetical protein
MARVCKTYQSCIMIAILSDIHGNLEAMDAVLRDAAAFDIRAILPR